ncbi:MAG TPA: hypothetical protein VF338_06570 [Leptolinea sp.]
MQQIRYWFRTHPLNWRMMQLFILLLLLFGTIQFSTLGLVDVDAYYHTKMAYLIRTEGIRPVFKWLPLTILNAKAYVDHHFLFHVFLIPFTFVGNLVLAGKLAAVTFASLAVWSCGIVLKQEKAIGAEFWALLVFASSTGFLFRMSMTRAQSLSLLWLILTVLVLLNRRWKWLIVLGWSFVWLYNAFPLMLVVVAVYFIAARITEGKWEWQPFIYTLAGIGLGLIINPYFPKNLAFIYEHYVAKLDISSVAVGMEWYPYETNALLRNSLLALVAFMAGIFAWGWSKERMRLPALFTFGLTLVFGIMVFQSKRFIEYFPPFPVLFAAFTIQPILQESKSRWYINAGAGLLLLIAVSYSLYQAKNDFSDTDSPALFSGSSQWLAQNTPENAMIFQTDWDDFGRLFHFNSHNIYIVGLDPTYLSLANKHLFDEWVDLTQGRGEDDWAAQIKRDFGACYAITDLQHSNFTSRADKDPKFTRVYKDNNSAVYQFCKLN